VTDDSVADGDEPEVPDDAEDKGGAYFPLSYITGMFDYFRRHSASISVLTYDDFAWDGDFDFASNYLNERTAWKAGLKSGRFDKSKAHVVVQYDVDTAPHRTLALLRHDAHRGMPANVMIFNRRIDRKKMRTAGELKFTPYIIDERFLRALQEERFVVGYHTNAFELGLHDETRALEAFDADASALNKKFGLKYFSAHGGVPDSGGRNNCDLPFHHAWASKLRWVHNGHSPYFDGQFSDGGHNSLNRNPAARDMRALVGRFRPGCRYRILLHPQYYSDVVNPSKRFSGTPWYEEVLALASEGNGAAIWSDAAVKSRSTAPTQGVAYKVAASVPEKPSGMVIVIKRALKRVLGA
jgi:hypothetical protein